MSAYGCFMCFAFTSGPKGRLFNMTRIFQIGWNMWKLHTDTWKNHNIDSILVELLSTKSTSQATSTHVETTSSQRNTCDFKAFKIDLESGAEWSILKAVWKPWLSLRETSGDFSRDPLYARCQAHQKLWHSIPSNQWISECWASLLSSSLSIPRFDAEIHEPVVLEELSEDFVSEKRHIEAT